MSSSPSTDINGRIQTGRTQKEVAPSSIKRETFYVAIAAATLLLIVGIYLAGKDKLETTPPLLDWQVSAFYDLAPVDQAIYNALLTASEELWWLHADMLAFNKAKKDDVTAAEAWPTVEQLANYYVVPPFAQNISSKQQGNVQWQRAAAFSFEGSAVYFGSKGQIAGQSAYLIVLNHAHKGASFSDGATIWVHKDSDTTMPSTIKRDSLIVNGWKQVVPYSGAMEVKRLKGDVSASL